MTTKWTVPQMFAGETVAVLASGPSMTQALADSVRHLPRIVTRRAFLLAPDADLLVAIDGVADQAFWDESVDFKGLRVCCVECDLDVLYLPLAHEVVTLGEGHTVHMRNNGLAAIRIAALGGAAKILLLGFDTERYEEIHGPLNGFTGLTAGLAALTAELRVQGIEVERVDTVAPAQDLGAEAR